MYFTALCCYPELDVAFHHIQVIIQDLSACISIHSRMYAQLYPQAEVQNKVAKIDTISERMKLLEKRLEVSYIHTLPQDSQHLRINQVSLHLHIPSQLKGTSWPHAH